MTENDDDSSNISPKLEEIEEYARLLGMDPVEDKEFMYIARQGLNEPLPEPWRMCKDENDNLIYHNPQTNEISEQHPCDEQYKQWFFREKQNQMIYQQQKQQHYQQQQNQQEQQQQTPPSHFKQQNQQMNQYMHVSQNESNIDLYDRNKVYSNQDFVTFNPPFGSFHGYLNFPNQARDVSISASFQTDINNLITSVNQQYSQLAERHIDQRNKELEQLQNQCQENTQKFRKQQENEIQEYQQFLRNKFSEDIQNKQKEQEDQLKIKKDKNLAKEQEYYLKNLQVEKERIDRRIDDKLKDERDQLETLNQLELQKVKYQFKSKLEIQKSRIQMDSDELQQLNDEEKKFLKELEEQRLQKEEELEGKMDSLDQEYRQEIKQIKSEQQRQKELTQQKVSSKFRAKLQEDKLYYEQMNRDYQQKKENYIEELKEKQKQRINLEKQRLDQELNDHKRDFKMKSTDIMQSSKEQVRLRLEMEYTQKENQMNLQQYREQRESRQENQDKYKLIKEREAKEEKYKIEKEFTQMREQLMDKYNEQTMEFGQNERVIKEIDILKKNIKELKQQKSMKQDDIEHFQLKRQKHKAKLEQTKQSILNQELQSKSNREKELENQLKEKEKEIAELSNDINRVRSFQVLSQKDQTITTDLEQVKQIIEEAMKYKQHEQERSDDPLSEINELNKLIPREIERVKDKLQKVEHEKQRLEELSQIVNADLLEGFKSYAQKDKSKRVVGLVTEFQVGMEQEQSNVKKDISRLQKHIDVLKDSLQLLQKLYKQSQSASKLQYEESRQDELKEEARQMRNDFKYHMRKVKATEQRYKQSEDYDDENTLIRKYQTEKNLYKNPNIEAKKYTGKNHIPQSLRQNQSYSGIFRQHNEWLSSNLKSLTMI